MKFKTEEERNKFLKDEKYFESLENYCLGNTQDEAGEIMRRIIEEKEKLDCLSNMPDSRKEWA